MSDRIAANVTHRFNASAERVYDAWLNPESVRVWLAAALKTFGLSGEIVRIEIDPQVGGRFFFSDLRDGVEAKHRGTYLELDRPNRIVFTWIVSDEEEPEPSVVTLEITPDGEGCVAAITHEMDAQWIDYIGKTEAGWLRMLEAVDQLLGRV